MSEYQYFTTSVKENAPQNERFNEKNYIHNPKSLKSITFNQLNNSQRIEFLLKFYHTLSDSNLQEMEIKFNRNIDIEILGHTSKWCGFVADQHYFDWDEFAKDSRVFVQENGNFIVLQYHQEFDFHSGYDDPCMMFYETCAYVNGVKYTSKYTPLFKKKDEICHWSKKLITGKILSSEFVNEVEDFFNHNWRNTFDKIIVPLLKSCQEKYKNCRPVYSSDDNIYYYESY
jgi:hypothetical protein